MVHEACNKDTGTEPELSFPVVATGEPGPCKYGSFDEQDGMADCILPDTLAAKEGMNRNLKRESSARWGRWTTDTWGSRQPSQLRYSPFHVDFGHA